MKTITRFIFAIALTSFIGLKDANAQAKKAATKTSATKTKTAVKSKPAVKPKTVIKPVVKHAQDNSIKVRIITDSGVMVLKLYDSTPLHRDNFVKLVQSGFYDSLMFHRVIPGFMIQGGDPESKYAPAGVQLGAGGGDMERIPAEFRPSLIHKKGVLAAARDGNPEKKSSACQFYIVEGRPATDAELDMFDKRRAVKYTAEQRQAYKTMGGTPFLDMDYTVYGEVISGMEVISKISGVQKDQANRPAGDIRMKIELVK